MVVVVKGNFVCPAFLQFCSFGTILLFVNLLIKADPTVICVHCMLEQICYEPLFLNCRFGRYLMLVG